MRIYKTKLSEQQIEYISILGRYISNLDLAKEFHISISTITNIKRKLGVKYIGNYKERLIDATKTYFTTSHAYIKDKVSELIFLPVAKKVIGDIKQRNIIYPTNGYLSLYIQLSNNPQLYEKIKERIKKKITIDMIIDELNRYILAKLFTSKYDLFRDLRNNLINKLAIER